MTAAKRARPKDYGPVQICTRLELSTWQVERAVEAGLLPPAGASGRWPAAVVDDALARREEIVAAAGALPDMGAYRAAGVLAERFGADVEAEVLLELERRGLVPRVGEYKGHSLYCGRALEAFADREALLAAAADGRLHTADGAAEYLRVRRSDFDHLTRSGWLTEVTRVRSRRQRSRESPAVPLFRTGDLDVLLAHPAIDWDAVRSTPRGRPSPLAQLGPWVRP
ncbi:hypothetical protein L3Q65_00290 (plasmid) [Amycolatopsis sp. FU40]|uniref:hypothetical protein n=1 Tax=Amycolatopsis sp. FU40 TaxID=2914159 RepID=UPI001F3590E2|nr:hypothetical protein [Amycolatopsis sp. FU40]UKD50738.1 hypothetical protein L3Q65_00290 [Amycolatopsis sp. FU40]